MTLRALLPCEMEKGLHQCVGFGKTGVVPWKAAGFLEVLLVRTHLIAVPGRRLQDPEKATLKDKILVV